jgi:heat shock protein HtpX
MIRTFQNIGSIQELNRIAIISLLYSVVTFVLKHYFIVFMRITNFISRKKEYRADELACFVSGVKPFERGLRKIHGAGMAWVPYWNTEVVPVLDQNCKPAIGEGFSRFLAVPDIAEQIVHGVEKELSEGKVEPFDTHPPLRDRLAALQQLGVPAKEENVTLAVSLLDAADSAELQFLTFLDPKFDVNSLRPVRWDDIGELVSIPGWKALVSEYSALLEGYTAASVPDLIPKLSQIGSQMRDPQRMLLNPQQRTRRAGQLVASALALALLDKGWQLESKPGVFYFHRGSEKLDIFAAAADLIAGKTSKDEWIDSCAKWSMSESLLVPARTLTTTV